MRFEDVSDADWQSALELNLLSYVRLIRTALPALRQSAAPSVLTVTSVSVKQPIPALVLSNSVRAATVGLTKTLALELGADGIRFNSILPSWTKTERVDKLLADRAQRNGTTIEQEINKQNQQSALGRMATPEEFAKAAAFLLSPAASYITGVMLTVDGGSYKGTF
jgi:3-oxoacyl-[acyl-carrier protein] reductase